MERTVGTIRSDGCKASLGCTGKAYLLLVGQQECPSLGVTRVRTLAVALNKILINNQPPTINAMINYG